MNCIIVDDEPLAREAMQMLIANDKGLNCLESFSNASAASKFLAVNNVDLILLDIQMPGMTGIDFAKILSPKTLVIFTTAYAEYAIDSYEVEAIDYLLKPVKKERFLKAIKKAFAYHKLLQSDKTINKIETVANDYFFVRAERKVFKAYFQDILFIEGLKDYVIIQTDGQKIITAMNIKTIHDQLPQSIFVRISKSYIINVQKITSFDNNTVFIQENAIPIGDAYRDYFFEEFVTKKMLKR